MKRGIIVKVIVVVAILGALIIGVSMMGKSKPSTPPSGDGAA